MQAWCGSLATDLEASARIAKQESRPGTSEGGGGARGGGGGAVSSENNACV